MAYDEGLTGDAEQDSILGGAAIGGLIGGAGGAGGGAVIGASREAPKGATGSGGNLTNENATKYDPQRVEPEENKPAIQQGSVSNETSAGDMIGAPIGELVGNGADDVSMAGSANQLPGSNTGTGSGGATAVDTSQLPDADSDQESHTGDAIENSETGSGMMGNASG